jgi:hypothetical protein
MGRVLVGVSLVAALFGQMPIPQPATRDGVIGGRVVDVATGRPLSNVVVMISGPTIGERPGPGEAPRILTGADGRFLFTALGAGTFTIYALKTGYTHPGGTPSTPVGSQNVTLVDRRRADDVVVRLARNGAITGTVTDEAGEPLVGVQVRALYKSIIGGRARFLPLGGPSSRLGSTTTTDDRGVYRLSNLLPGEYLIAAAAPQVSVPMATLKGAGLGTVRMVFEAGGVMALPGSPQAIQVGDAAYRLGGGNATPPPPSEQRLFVYPPTFHPSALTPAQATRVAIAAGEERASVDLQMQPARAGRVSGVLAGIDVPVTPITVRLVPAEHDELSFGEDLLVTLTDGGSFVFPAVPPGAYFLRAQRRGSRADGSPPDAGLFLDMPIAATGDDIDGVIAVLHPGSRVTGRFEFEGTAERPTPLQIPRIVLGVEPYNALTSSTFMPPPRGDESGQFASPEYAPGKYFLRVMESPPGWMYKSATLGGRDITDTPLDLRRGDVTGIVLTFTDRWSGLGGSVRNAEGAPDTTAMVLAFPVDRQSWSDFGNNPRRLRASRPNAKGEFNLSSLPPGDYYAVAVPAAQATNWREPATLETLARIASRITIGEGEHRTHDFITRDARQ